jgi:hypothetical protein
MEVCFGDDIFRMTTCDPEYNIMGMSQFVDSPPIVSFDLYQESLNEWVMHFTTAGMGTSLEIPGSQCGQNDTSLRTSPSYQYPGDPHLALTNGHYAGEMEPELSCTKEEGNGQWGRKNKTKHQSRTGEERDCVQRRRKRAFQNGEGTTVVQRGKRSSQLENGEERKIVQRRRKRVSQFVSREGKGVRRSERVCRAPTRYIDEWCKSKEKGKIKSKRAGMTASKGLVQFFSIYL